MPERFNVIKDILEEFHREIKEIDTEISKNQQSISEADVYIGSLLNAETDDFKVFSPRKAEIIYKEDLEKARAKKSACENANGNLNRRKELLSGYIHKLEDILQHLPQEPAIKPKTIEELQKEILEDLDPLTQRLEIAAAHIEKNPLQARQELAVIGKYLSKVIDKMKHCNN